MNIPNDHQIVMPYLIVNNANGLIDFLKAVFNANLLQKQTNDDHKIVHAQVAIGDSTLMLSDAREPWSPQPAGMFIYVDNADDTFLKAIENGASSIMPVEDMDYGRSGGVLDEFGNTWWITQPL